MFPVTNHKGHRILPTHIGEHSHYSRLPLPMWRVHPKDYAHHLSHPFTLPPTCCPGCRLQDVTAFLGAFAMVLIEGHLISWLPAPDGNLQVLVWRHPIVSCCKLFHAPRWWAGYANPCPSSVFHQALTTASGFTRGWARPCTTPLQGPKALWCKLPRRYAWRRLLPRGLPRLPRPW